ncbi:MAG: DotI/IcmL/TraM family protein, partial [Gammaproteobacteria bacterium]
MQENEITLDNNEHFYRDFRGWTLTLFFFVSILFAALVILAMDMTQFVPTKRYFAVDREKRLIQEPPLNQALLSDNALLTWTSEALMNSASGNFMTFVKMRMEAKQYFTESGYDSYLDLLDATDLKKRVEGSRYVVSAAVSKARLLSSGTVAGVYAWNADTKRKFKLISA